MFRTVLLISLLTSGIIHAQDSHTTAAADTTDRSELTVGLIRESRTFFLGRELDTRIPSYTPTISYAHKSGLFLNATGFYANKNQPPPHYVFTDLEAGYASQFTDQWTYSISVSHLFFSKPQLTTADIPPIRNGLELYSAYKLGPLSAGLDYTYYFDRQHAHLLMAILSSTLFSRKHWLGLDEVSIIPSVNAYWGTANVLQRYGGLYEGVLTSVSSSAGTTTIRRRRRNPITTTTAGQPITADVSAGHLYRLGAELAVPLRVVWQKNTFTLTNHTIMTTHLPDDISPRRLINFLSFGIARTF